MASAAQLTLEAYAELYESRAFTDFTFATSDGVELFAHRAILAAHSKVLLRMLSTEGSMEVLTGRYEVTDVDKRTMDLLLRFMYTSFVTTEDLTMRTVEKLLVAADKYDVWDLHAAFLKQRPTNGTAADFLILADRYGITELKAAALDYFAKCRRHFFVAGHLVTLSYYKPSLMQEVVERVSSRGERIKLRAYCSNCVTASVCTHECAYAYSD